MMSRALLNKITLALTVVGCIIAIVLTYEHFRPVAEIGCRAVGGDCHKTIESVYGKLGPIPTSVMGLGMYLTLAGICLLRARNLAGSNAPGSEEKPLGVALFGISVLAFCISWWLQYTSLFVIRSFCPWCFASALTVTAICAVNAYDYLILGRALTGEQKMLSGVLAFIAAMLAFMYAPQILFQWHIVMNPPVTQGNSDPPMPPGSMNPPGVHPREELLSKGLLFKGKPTASYTIIEFADYACSHCAQASEEMNALMQKYPDRYRLAFRNYPLGRWPYSQAEAAAAEAAGKQGKFWEMHDLLFAHQHDVETPDFGPAKILDWGRAIGLDVTRLKKEMESATMIARVRQDYRIGEKNRIKSTPSFFVVPSDPKGKVMMIVGEVDLKAVLSDPQDSFWRGDPHSLKNPEAVAND